MFSQTARYYDLIYGTLKDYADEANKLAALIRAHRPNAQRILDIACGTGEHARHLTQRHGFQVDGIDLEPVFVAIARSKNPRGAFSVADMLDFELGKQYPVVTCLFGSIAYTRTIEGLERVLANLVRHLTDDGLLILEPFLAPEDVRDGYVTMTSGENDDTKICRMSHTQKVGSVSRITFEYLIGDRTGVHHARETHEIGLFTRDDFERAFADVKCNVEYDSAGIFGRGLYVAERRS
jgi:SAM-dependent methyltransferase